MAKVANQNPEQKARDQIDNMLRTAGWAVQSKKKADLGASKGVAVREYQTDVGPADYVLFVDRKPVGVIEAKREEEGERFVYRLLKHADAKRILFVVDTKNLGEQAEQEFLKYQPTDDNRKFTELYNVQRLSSHYIASDSQVCISTIQHLCAILKGGRPGQ